MFGYNGGICYNEYGNRKVWCNFRVNCLKVDLNLKSFYSSGVGMDIKYYDHSNEALPDEDPFSKLLIDKYDEYEEKFEYSPKYVQKMKC
jgi:hypothetical protein